MPKASDKWARPPSQSSLQMRALRHPGRIWVLLILGSLTLNLVMIALLASLYEGEGTPGCKAERSILVAEEKKSVVAAPQQQSTAEELVSAEEISVSSTSGKLPASKDAIINLDQ
ncbi:hypothetical protein BHM03_00023946 [Ensete ventricosum]|nr:hypothetical protein BHM03_00023946 [Ensete ventricosum]